MTMALLPKKTRIRYLKDLGYDYNDKGVLKIQKKYFSDPDEWDNKYGKKTDILLRHLHNVWKVCTHFKPEEFKCTCGHCTGYPTQMRVDELRHIERIRTHYNKPMVITSALRCEYQNKKVGGYSDSRHKVGKAVDFYMVGVTDTFHNRVNSIKYIKTLPNHHYTYGHGINSLGAYVSRPSMGNALHTDVR